MKAQQNQSSQVAAYHVAHACRQGGLDVVPQSHKYLRSKVGNWRTWTWLGTLWRLMVCQLRKPWHGSFRQGLPIWDHGARLEWKHSNINWRPTLVKTGWPEANPNNYSAPAWSRWARLTQIDVCENLWGVCNSISLWSQLLPAWSSPQCKQSIPHGFWHPFVFQAASDLQVVEMWVESYCTLRSLNRLDFAACAALGEGLRDNHSLYGLHVVGNLPSKTNKQRH